MCTVERTGRRNHQTTGMIVLGQGTVCFDLYIVGDIAQHLFSWSQLSVQNVPERLGRQVFAVLGQSWVKVWISCVRSNWAKLPLKGICICICITSCDIIRVDVTERSDCRAFLWHASERHASCIVTDCNFQQLGVLHETIFNAKSHTVILQPCLEVQPDHLTSTSRFERRKFACCSCEAITDHTPSAVRPLEIWSTCCSSYSKLGHCCHCLDLTKKVVRPTASPGEQQSPKTRFHSHPRLVSQSAWGLLRTYRPVSLTAVQYARPKRQMHKVSTDRQYGTTQSVFPITHCLSSW